MNDWHQTLGPVLNSDAPLSRAGVIGAAVCVVWGAAVAAWCAAKLRRRWSGRSRFARQALERGFDHEEAMNLWRIVRFLARGRRPRGHPRFVRGVRSLPARGRGSRRRRPGPLARVSLRFRDERPAAQVRQHAPGAPAHQRHARDRNEPAGARPSRPFAHDVRFLRSKRRAGQLAVVAARRRDVAAGDGTGGLPGVHVVLAPARRAV